MSIHAMSDDEFADFDRDPADIHNPEPTVEELDEGLARWMNPDEEENYDDCVEVPDLDEDTPLSDDFEASEDF